MPEAFNILLCSFLIQQILAILVTVKEGKTINYKITLAIILSIILSLFANLDIFKVLNVGINPVVGQILTGLLISRGSNFVNEILEFAKTLTK